MKSNARLLLAAAVVMTALSATASPAHAHGEAAQEAFLRTQTATFFDINFSDRSVAVGDELVLSGKVKLLNAWPAVLPQPEVAYLTVNIPGPTFILRDRRVGGEFVPQSIVVEKGGVYDFTLTLVARRPGHWHMHPALAIEGTGTLVGPGRRIEVTPGDDFRNMVALATGETVDLETYGVGDVLVWHLVTLAIGGLWLLWWLVPRPLLHRMIWVRQGVEHRLITPLDRKVAVGLGIAAVAALVIGNVIARSRYPTSIPHQTYLMEAPRAAIPPAPVEVDVQGATFDPADDRLVVETRFQNRSSAPLRVTGFTTASVTFDVGETGRSLEVLPRPTLAPGEDAVLRLQMTDAVWHEEHLIDTRQAQMALGGLLFFEDEWGRRSFEEIRSFVMPRFDRHERDHHE